MLKRVFRYLRRALFPRRTDGGQRACRSDANPVPSRSTKKPHCAVIDICGLVAVFFYVLVWLLVLGGATLSIWTLVSHGEPLTWAHVNTVALFGTLLFFTAAAVAWFVGLVALAWLPMTKAIAGYLSRATPMISSILVVLGIASLTVFVVTFLIRAYQWVVATAG